MINWAGKTYSQIAWLAKKGYLIPRMKMAFFFLFEKSRTAGAVGFQRVY